MSKDPTFEDRTDPFAEEKSYDRSRIYYLYYHTTLDTKEVFYVGKGKRDRAFQKKGRNPFWKNVVAKHDYKVTILVSNIDEELAFMLEKALIMYFRNKGLAKCNMTDGGEGASGLKHRPESIEKMKGNTNAKGNKGKKFKNWSDERKKAHSDLNKKIKQERIWTTPYGVFANRRDAGIAEGVSGQTISNRSRSAKFSGYSFEFLPGKEPKT